MVLSFESGSFSCCLNPHRFFQLEVLKLISLHWNPVLLGLSHSPFVPPGLSTCKCGTAGHVSPPCPPWSCSCCFAGSPLCPRCPSLTLLPVWMSVSSLTPWLSDFHTVQFSGIAGCLFVFKFVVVLLLVVQGGKVYLPMSLSWLEVYFTNLKKYLIYF